MTKTNETLNTNELQENFLSEGENYAFSTNPKTKSRRRKHTELGLIETCFICDTQIKIKLHPVKKTHSLKNNWGYWTNKPTDQKKHACDDCLTRILDTDYIYEWVDDKEKASTFRTYLYRGQFGQKNLVKVKQNAW